jgi:hypothetical protein
MIEEGQQISAPSKQEHYSGADMKAPHPPSLKMSFLNLDKEPSQASF